MNKHQEIRIDRNPTKKDIKQLEDCLVAYNNDFVEEDFKPFGIVVRNDNGQIVAGVSGSSFWGRAYIKYIWVDNKYRNQGIGSTLLKEADQLLKSRNCRGVEVDTMSFQAIGFYEKNGFSQHSRIQNFVDGHHCIYYTKDYKL